jgi:hypothetical protein
VRFAYERMPVILPREAERPRLDEGKEELLRPYPPEEMTRLAVSAFVNSARNEGPQCVEPAGPAQGSHFGGPLLCPSIPDSFPSAALAPRPAPVENAPWAPKRPPMVERRVARSPASPRPASRAAPFGKAEAPPRFRGAWRP